MVQAGDMAVEHEEIYGLVIFIDLVQLDGYNAILDLIQCGPNQPDTPHADLFKKFILPELAPREEIS